MEEERQVFWSKITTSVEGMKREQSLEVMVGYLGTV
jgi:hypothetical protein